MTKYFIITEKTRLNKEYYAYKENNERVHLIARLFMETHGIKAKEYARSTERFFINPEQEDMERFEKMFKKEKSMGLYEFKKTSEIGKDWIQTLKEAKLTVYHKPMIAFEFSKFAGGRYTNRLFDIDGVVYLSFDCGYEVDTPEGFQEIKASEFHKVIEDYETKIDK